MNYFTYKEFDSPDMPGSGSLMDETFIEMLNEVREKFGKSIVINIKGLSAKISCTDSFDRYYLIYLLQEIGFQRIAIASDFIYVELNFEESQQVIELLV